MSQTFVQSFHEAAPYIHYLRGKTLVIGIASELLTNPNSLNALATDFNLMVALGIRLVLVHGCDTHLAEMYAAQNHATHINQNRRVIDDTALLWAQQFCGVTQFHFQAALAMGVAQTPQRPPRLRLVSGNFLTAKPLGVLNGIDMKWAGEIRKIDTPAIQELLANQSIVWISPIAASLGGQNYVLSMPNMAAEVAIALHAEKLIFLTAENGILNQQNQLIENLTAQQTQELLQQNYLHNKQQTILHAALHALRHNISRTQIISGSQHGDLIRELFTRQGAGTSIAQDSFVNIRAANERDIIDIINLIRPLEERGVLIPRSHEYLENHIHEFFMLEHDRQIYGCVALKTFDSSPNCAELACLVVSPNARDGGYGEKLLAHVIDTAKKMDKTQLFALSTHTADWFRERGFQPAQPIDLPTERLAEYTASGRQSKIFILPLN